MNVVGNPNATQGNNTTIETDTSTTTTSATEPPRKRARIEWVSTKVKRDGKFVFLGSGNVKDLYLLRQLMTTPPWEAGFGHITGAWEDVANLLSTHKDANGTLIYGEHIKDKHVRDRFKILMDFCRKSITDNSFRSGCDDDDPPTEIETLMEQVYEMHSSFLIGEKKTTETKKNQAKRNREQAKVIRDAALGLHSRELTLDLSGDGPRKKKNNAESASDDLDLAGLIGCAKSILSPVSTELGVGEQHAYKLRRIELQERRLKLEEEELEMKKSERLQEVEDRKLDREERRHMMENTAKMQDALLQIVTKLTEK